MPILDDPIREERERILSQVPKGPDPKALRQGHMLGVRAHGRIPQETRDDWLRMIRDPSYDLQFRQLMHRTAKEAIEGIGEAFVEPEPVVKKASDMLSHGQYRFGENVPESHPEAVMERKKRIYFARKAELDAEQEAAINSAKKRHRAELVAIGKSFDELFRANAAEYGLR